MESANRQLVDLGAGKRHDCWYLCAEAALNELGQSFGPPDEFRRKLAMYAMQHVLPSYTAASEGHSEAMKAVRRIELGEMAQCLSLIHISEPTRPY